MSQPASPRSTSDVLRDALSAHGVQAVCYRRLPDSDLIGVVWHADTDDRELLARGAGRWGVGTVNEAAGTAELEPGRRVSASGLRRSAVTDALDTHVELLARRRRADRQN